MPTKPQNSNQLWESLEQAQTLPAPRVLRHLSGLLEPDLTRLAQLWHTLPNPLRLTLVQTLVEMSEADFELDFTGVFYLAMKDADAGVRAAAIDGLHEDEDPRLVPLLLTALTTDPAPEVRIAAAQTLAHFVLLGELDKLRPQPFELICQPLLAAHNDSNAPLELRRRALESLAYTALHNVPELIQAAITYPEEKMRVSAIFAMGRSADKRWAAPVQQALRHPNPEMRYEATRACGELELREAVPELVDLIKDVDSEVQTMALWALGQINSDLARRTLQHYSQSANEALRDAATDALGELDFLYGDITTFFGPPDAFDGESDLTWDDADAELTDDDNV